MRSELYLLALPYQFEQAFKFLFYHTMSCEITNRSLYKTLGCVVFLGIHYVFSRIIE